MVLDQCPYCEEEIDDPVQHLWDCEEASRESRSESE